MQKKFLLASLCVVFAFLLLACAKPEGSTNRSDSTAPASNATTPATMASNSGEKIGVAECDDFIAAYDACVSSKVPEVARAEYKAGLEQLRTSWRKLAANPNTRGSLAAACKQSAEQAKEQMKLYKCTF